MKGGNEWLRDKAAEGAERTRNERVLEKAAGVSLPPSEASEYKEEEEGNQDSEQKEKAKEFLQKLSTLRKRLETDLEEDQKIPVGREKEQENWRREKEELDKRMEKKSRKQEEKKTEPREEEKGKGKDRCAESERR